ncbi:MAG: hypothetical protein NT064_00940 [Proteobacteria bacterium]|nr:hypothetical protein [Pseudomonadota bacterium]
MNWQCRDCGAVFENAALLSTSNRCTRCEREQQKINKENDLQQRENYKKMARDVSSVIGSSASSVGSIASGTGSVFKGIYKAGYAFFKWAVIVAAFVYVYLGKGTWTLLSVIFPNKFTASPWDIKNNKLPWKEKDWILGLLVFLGVMAILQIPLIMLGLV